MKILISGAYGFIGQNLIPYLESKVEGVDFIRLTREKRGEGKELLWSELEKYDTDVDAVVHLAGLAHDTKNTLDNAAYYEVNYELTKRLFDWYEKTTANKFIYISSVKAIADSVKGALTEEYIPEPITAYGKSKLQAEQYIRQQAKMITNKRYYILRPCMVHGPGNKGNLNLLYQFVKKGLPYPLGAYDNKRSFLSVENFCYVTHELLVRDIDSDSFNLADDGVLSTKDLFRIIAEVVDKKAKVWQVPKGVINTLAKAGNVLKLPLNTERLDKLTENYIVSNARVKKALGISSMPVGIEVGLRKTISSFEE